MPAAVRVWLTGMKYKLVLTGAANDSLEVSGQAKLRGDRRLLRLVNALEYIYVGEVAVDPVVGIKRAIRGDR